MAETKSPFDDSKSLPQNSDKLQDQKNPFVCFFLNLFEAVKLPFLQKNIAKIEPAEPIKIQPTESIKVQPTEPIKVQPAEPIKVQPAEPIKIQPADPIKIQPVLSEDENNKPGAITFPPQGFTPLKLEAEAEVAETKTNPVILWQVYAIGGFFVLRWAWMKWNERKGQKKSDDEPPPSRG